MKIFIVGVICLVVGGVIGAFIGGELVGRSMPSAGDRMAVSLTGSYGQLTDRGGALIEPSEVRDRTLTTFAQEFITTGAFYSQITDDSLRWRVSAIAKEALRSGLLEAVPQSDLRKESVAWAGCMTAGGEAERDLPKCVLHRKSKS